ncbi:MAG: elongation factor G [Planctomycetaceae bacterium]
MPKHPVSELRNVVLVGHGSVGKTSLADLMLFESGEKKKVGSPDDGTSNLDVDDDEKDRHHSVTSHICHFEHANARINLLDAPGMPDFIGHAIGALRAAETALVTINARAGIEVNCRRAFQHAGNRGLGRFIIVNKCDEEDIDLPALVDSIQQQFGAACALMNVPVGIGASLSGVVSTVRPPESIPDGVTLDVAAANQRVIDAAVEADEDLMMRYLEEAAISPDEIDAAIVKAVVAGTLIPVFFTSVKMDVGVKELMDGIAAYAPSPKQLQRHVTVDGEDQAVDPDANGPLVAQVVKTRIDPYLSKVSYIRIYSGTLKRDSQVHVVGQNGAVKVHQLLDFQGGEYDQVDEAIAGNIVAVTKIDDFHTGNTLSDGSDRIKMPPIAFPRPMISLAVEPKSQADQTKISLALHKIEEEDPSFHVHHEEQTHELLMEGMSDLHLKLIEKRLHDREKVDIITHEPRIPYRETITGEAEGSFRHKKQSGGSGQFAEVHLKLSAFPHGVSLDEYINKDRFPHLRTYNHDEQLHFVFIDRVSGGSVPNQFIPAVEKGIREQMVRGVIAGYQVQDVVVELFFGKDHPVDSNETAFKIAGAHCFKELFEKARPSLLEPIAALEVTVPNAHIGDITKDLNTRRGRMEGVDEIPGGFSVIHAKVPLANVKTYARTISSLTGGQGSFTMEFSSYELLPPNEQQQVIEEAKRHAAG